ncbi:hypothetical protein EW026_g715 [Hermanssonia centrifuga]|uniref:Aminoglycoside phosphotransferase domain-containing protein n=1 Tax=Hermanssonia centrifuga TaxID=98765 RepID=A0A4S4KUU6_9APHY|nr:hypothetical protein EW026_g715 [Hermanssonia centrifuga]
MSEPNATLIEHDGVPSLSSEILNPSDEQIQDVVAAMHAAKKRPSSWEPGTFRGFSLNAQLCDLGDGRVVKFGKPVASSEALAMEYVRQNTTIPVPKVHMVFVRERMTHIVMDLVPGSKFMEAAFRMSEDELRQFFEQLRDYVTQLQNLGGLHVGMAFRQWPSGGPLRNTHFCSPYPDHEFQSLEELHTYWLQRAINESTDISGLTTVPPGTAKTTLGHGELIPANIMVRGGEIVGILDWETFGWYPDFWDSIFIHDICGFTGATIRAVRATFGVLSDLAVHFRNLIRKAEYNSSRL